MAAVSGGIRRLSGSGGARQGGGARQLQAAWRYGGGALLLRGGARRGGGKGRRWCYIRGRGGVILGKGQAAAAGATRTPVGVRLGQAGEREGGSAALGPLGLRPSLVWNFFLK